MDSIDPLAQLAEEVQQQPFTTRKSLEKSLECSQRVLEQDQTQNQHLIFTSVPPEQSSKVGDDRARTSKYCRFAFNAETGLLIAKVMPNPAHERC